MRPDRMDQVEHSLVADIMAHRDAVFIDIGANAGLYSLRAALSATQGGTVLAVEPNAALVERLVFNIDAARKSGNMLPGVAVRIANVAISDYDGLGTLSFESKEGTRRLVEKQGGQRVVVKRLTTLLAEYQIARIDILKVDVEGHEDRVLPPFFLTSQSTLWPRVVIIEHLARALWSVDCIADILRRSYRLVVTTKQNTILERE